MRARPGSRPLRVLVLAIVGLARLAGACTAAPPDDEEQSGAAIRGSVGGAADARKAEARERETKAMAEKAAADAVRAKSLRARVVDFYGRAEKKTFVEVPIDGGIACVGKHPARRAFQSRTFQDRYAFHPDFLSFQELFRKMDLDLEFSIVEEPSPTTSSGFDLTFVARTSIFVHAVVEPVCKASGALREGALFMKCRGVVDGALRLDQCAAE